MEFTYDGLVRYSFGFYNPNHAAALITMILPILWGLRRYFKNIHLKFAVICIEIIFYIALVLTYSRTAIGALILSVIFFYTLTHFYLIKTEPLKIWGQKSVKIEILVVGEIGLVIAIAALATGSIERYFKWIISPDKAVTNRFSLWKGAFQMIADNPDGVGTGLSGRIFTDFMQAPNASGEYRTMVNSFLTFICEQGLVPFFIIMAIAAFLIFASLKIISSKIATFRVKLLFITANAVLFSAFVNGCFSTCFDLSVLLDLKNGPIETNNIMQTFLFFFAVSVAIFLLCVCINNRTLFSFKKTIVTSLLASIIISISIFLCGYFLKGTDVPKVRAFTINGMNFVKIIPTDTTAKSFLILPDSGMTGQKKIRQFIKGKFGNMTMIFPLSTVSSNIPADLLSYNDYLVICGKNASINYNLENPPSGKLKLIYYLPSTEPSVLVLPVHKIYLNEFDEHGINSTWEKNFPSEIIEYGY